MAFKRSWVRLPSTPLLSLHHFAPRIFPIESTMPPLVLPPPDRTRWLRPRDQRGIQLSQSIRSLWIFATALDCHEFATRTADAVGRNHRRGPAEPSRGRGRRRLGIAAAATVATASANTMFHGVAPRPALTITRRAGGARH